MAITDMIADGISSKVNDNINTKIEEYNKIVTNSVSSRKNKKNEKSIDVIKKVMNYDYKPNIKNYEYTNEQKQSKLIKSIYEESNYFYKENMRTSLLKTIIEKIDSKVLDDYKLLLKEEELKTLITKEGFEFKINEINELLKIGILNNEINFKVNLKKGKYEIKPIWNCDLLAKTDEKVDIYVKKDTIERRKRDRIEIIKINEDGKEEVTNVVKHKYDNLLFYKYEFKVDVMNKGILELVLLYSELINAIQKEVKIGTIQNFIDSGYLKNSSELKEHYVVVDSPDTSLDITAQSKPLFEYVNPTLKSADYSTYQEFLKQEISSILHLDRSVLGFSQETATASRIASAQSIETINKIKKDFERVINIFLEDFFRNIKYNFIVKEYQIKNEEILYRNISTALSSGFMTIEEAVRKANPDYTSEKVEKEYLKLMYQKGIPFTHEEEKKATKYGIIIKEGINEPIL